MVQFAIAARALLLASINASEFVVDEQGVYSFTNRHVTFGQELFSKVCVCCIQCVLFTISTHSNKTSLVYKCL